MYCPLSPPLQHSIFSASLGLFYQVHHSVLSSHSLPYFLPFPSDTSFDTWPFVTTAAAQHLQCQPGLVLPGTSFLLFFASSALLSYLSHRILPFTHGHLSSPQYLQRQPRLVLPSPSSHSFFASSALLSSLSHQTHPFTHYPLSPPL